LITIFFIQIDSPVIVRLRIEMSPNIAPPPTSPCVCVLPAAVGLPAVMDDGEQSAAERTEAIAAAVNERLEEIERILAKCA
jgi:hypothetical protein